MQLDLSFSLEPKSPSAASSSEPEILSVSELTKRVKRLLESKIGSVWVRGEISNHRRQASGHHFFTLKDATSSLSCVMFAGDARLLRGVKIEDGIEVQVSGDITVYEARGNYQMVVRFLQAKGAGQLQAKFEALKRRLDAEGLFAAERKRSLPPHPQTIGVITSRTGAALRDFLDVLWRRSPGMRVQLYPVRVQGKGAAAEIAGAVQTANQMAPADRPDVLVLTRGGGSIEDLWEFNEESVARAVAASAIPTVSAVGHEIDFTICDFAADHRAPTPSAAAEILSAETAALQKHLLLSARRMQRVCFGEFQARRHVLQRVLASSIFRFPERIPREFQLQVGEKADQLQDLLRGRMESLQRRAFESAASLQKFHPRQWLEIRREEFASRRKRLLSIPPQDLRSRRERLEKISHMLRALNPENTLARGFTITFAPDGTALRSSKEAAGQARLLTRFPDGEVSSVPTQP